MRENSRENQRAVLRTNYMIGGITQWLECACTPPLNPRPTDSQNCSGSVILSSKRLDVLTLL